MLTKKEYFTSTVSSSGINFERGLHGVFGVSQKIPTEKKEKM
jgi:hypothetical protein